MIKKVVLLILVLAFSISFVAGQQSIHEKDTGLASPGTKETTQRTDQVLQRSNDSQFLEDFNSINNPYKEALFATGQGRRNESINYYENLTKALTVFQEKYKYYRPAAIKSDKQFSGDITNVSVIILGVRDYVYTGNLTLAHKKLEEVRPIFQNILNRNGLLPLSVALVDFHDVMELVLDAADNQNASKVLEIYPLADEKLKAVESISDTSDVKSIRTNLDEIRDLAKENKPNQLPAKANDLKSSYVKVYLASS